MIDGETTLKVFPQDTTESASILVPFGAATDEFTFLLQSDPSPGGGTRIKIGNGPTLQEVPAQMPELLRSVASLLEVVDKDRTYPKSPNQTYTLI